MPYYTIDEMRQRGQIAARSTYQRTDELLRKSARTERRLFDIFLSHSFKDADAIWGVKNLLESNGKSVYVDWLDDPLLDRSRVTPATASQLRSRMQQCSSLVYATSPAAATSKWMPWELGYFDGRKGPEAVAIMPLVRSSTEPVGQEYIGLYPQVDHSDYSQTVRVSRRTSGRLETKSLDSLVRGSSTYR